MIMSFRMQGAKEALFIITLASHGYLFVGKEIIQAGTWETSTSPSESTLKTLTTAIVKARKNAKLERISPFVSVGSRSIVQCPRSVSTTLTLMTSLVYFRTSWIKMIVPKKEMIHGRTLYFITMVYLYTVLRENSRAKPLAL